MLWPLSIDETKVLSIALILCMGLASLTSKRLNLLTIFVAFTFYIVSFPLGHDTLNYIQIFEADELSRYGIIWGGIDYIAKLFESWIFIYAITYAIIVFATYKLAVKSMNPSLLFIGVTLSPSIGFDFLSIVRQGLATAMLMLAYSYYLSSKGRLVVPTAIASIAVLSHTASIIAPAIFFLKSINNIPKKNVISLLLFSIIAILLVSFFFGKPILDFFYLQLPYMIDSYILSRDESVPGGRFIFLYWILILSLDQLLKLIFNLKICLFKINRLIIFITFYFAFLSISPPMARIIWFIMPIVLFHYINDVESRLSYAIRDLHRFLFVTLLLSASIYGVFISRDSFWSGAY
jgi:hypothetical protein